VGTSGWSYRGWIGPFYPEGTSASRMLSEYAAAGLSAVEAHSTYRKRPTIETLEKWITAVPESFRFAPKAHAAISHQRDLDGIEDRTVAFFTTLESLGARRGPVMYSLPHKHVDLDRLDRLLGAIPDGAHAAFELDPAWHQRAVLDRLDARGSTLVIVDRDADDAAEVPACGTFSYVRLRRTHYSEPDIEAWAERLRGLRSGGRDVYAFVRHDDVGDAPQWARALQESV
jgi:uncharacterized protein YecE (DUF72 family)